MLTKFLLLFFVAAAAGPRRPLSDLAQQGRRRVVPVRDKTQTACDIAVTSVTYKLAPRLHTGREEGPIDDELRPVTAACDLGDYAGVRSGLRPLPRIRAARPELRRTQHRRGIRVAGRSKALRKSADGVHRRRSVEAARSVQPDAPQ